MSCGLRDVLEFEALDRPAVLVASSAFADGATEQARLLGQPELRRAFGEHPVQDRTDDELRAMARDAGVEGTSGMRKDELVDALSDGGSGGSSGTSSDGNGSGGDGPDGGRVRHGDNESRSKDGRPSTFHRLENPNG